MSKDDCFLKSQTFEPYCDSDKQTPPRVICIRMLYGKLVLANTLMRLLSIFSQENQTGSIEKET